MPTGRHLSTGTKLVMTAAALIAIIFGIVVAQGVFAPSAEPVRSNGDNGMVPAPGTALLEPEPTDTVVTGAIDAIGTGPGQDELWLVQKKGEEVTSTKLILDDHSYCNIGSGGLPCMAMSITYSTAFGGKKALVDGNKEGDTIRVRRLRILGDDETPRVLDAGSVYIAWQRASDMIKNCEVMMLVQTHEGLVNITTKEGRKLVAVEPVIDDVFKVTNEATDACGSIGIATE